MRKSLFEKTLKNLVDMAKVSDFAAKNHYAIEDKIEAKHLAACLRECRRSLLYHTFTAQDAEKLYDRQKEV